MSDFQSELKEIIYYITLDPEAHAENKALELKSFSLDEALVTISQLIDKVVGEDESEGRRVKAVMVGAYVRNKLRAELRQAFGLGGKDVL